MILIYQTIYSIVLYLNNKYFHKNNSIYLYILMGIMSPLSVFLLREYKLVNLNINVFDQLVISIIWFLQSNYLLYKAISNKINGNENFTNIIYLFGICAFNLVVYKNLVVILLLSIKLINEVRNQALEGFTIVALLLLLFLNFSNYPVSIYIVNILTATLFLLQMTKSKNRLDFFIVFSLISLVHIKYESVYNYFIISLFIILNIRIVADLEVFKKLHELLKSIDIIERIDINLKMRNTKFRINSFPIWDKEILEKTITINPISSVKYKMDYKLTYILFAFFILYILIRGALI